jgi:hypothetical protein
MLFLLSLLCLLHCSLDGVAFQFPTFSLSFCTVSQRSSFSSLHRGRKSDFEYDIDQLPDPFERALFEEARKKSKSKRKILTTDELEELKIKSLTRKYLRKVINFDKSELEIVRTLYPWFFDLSLNSTIKPMVAFLKETYGFRNQGLRILIKSYPLIFQLPINDTREKFDLLKKEIRLTNGQVNQIIEKQPLILSLTTTKIMEYLDFFRKVVEFDKDQLKYFFQKQFRVWRTPIQQLKDYYCNLRTLNLSPEGIQGKLLSNMQNQRKFSFFHQRSGDYDERYLTEFLD